MLSSCWNIITFIVMIMIYLYSINYHYHYIFPLLQLYGEGAMKGHFVQLLTIMYTIKLIYLDLTDSDSLNLINKK